MTVESLQKYHPNQKFLQENSHQYLKRDGAPNWVTPVISPNLYSTILLGWLAIFTMTSATAVFIGWTFGDAALCAAAIFNIAVIVIQFGHTNTEHLIHGKSGVSLTGSD